MTRGKDSQEISDLHPVAAAEVSLTAPLPQRLRVEANFLKFPFFVLRKGSGNSSGFSPSVELTLGARRGGEKGKISWRVLPPGGVPPPGEFARRLHREVVERILSDLPKPIRNPVRLGSFSDICRMLELAPSGRTIREIRSAFSSIKRTTIQTHGAYYVKNQDCYIDDEFSLYDRIVFTGASLPDGGRADAVYIYLGSWYLENLNSNYVIPLDFQFLRQLRGAITSRMYELFHHWFFTALRENTPAVERRYSTLCAYFPLSRQNALWKAKQQLREAHKQLREAGYLGQLPSWRPVPNVPGDWLLLYTPGTRARQEYRRNQSRRNQDVLFPEEAAERLPEVVGAGALEGDALTDVERDLIRELELRGISQGIAQGMVQAHAPAFLQMKVEAFDWLMGKAERPITQNPAGYLRASIEQDYGLPEGFISREERHRKEAEEAACRQAKEAEEVRVSEQEAKRKERLEAVWRGLSPEEQVVVRKEAELNLNGFARTRLLEEERGGRRGVGHISLQNEIHKLLERR